MSTRLNHTQNASRSALGSPILDAPDRWVVFDTCSGVPGASFSPQGYHTSERRFSVGQRLLGSSRLLRVVDAIRTASVFARPVSGHACAAEKCPSTPCTFMSSRVLIFPAILDGYLLQHSSACVHPSVGCFMMLETHKWRQAHVDVENPPDIVDFFPLAFVAPLRTRKHARFTGSFLSCRVTRCVCVCARVCASVCECARIMFLSFFSLDFSLSPRRSSQRTRLALHLILLFGVTQHVGLQCTDACAHAWGTSHRECELRPYLPDRAAAIRRGLETTTPRLAERPHRHHHSATPPHRSAGL